MLGVIHEAGAGGSLGTGTGPLKADGGLSEGMGAKRGLPAAGAGIGMIGGSEGTSGGGAGEGKGIKATGADLTIVSLLNKASTAPVPCDVALLICIGCLTILSAGCICRVCPVPSSRTISKVRESAIMLVSASRLHEIDPPAGAAHQACFSVQEKIGGGRGLAIPCAKE